MDGSAEIIDLQAYLDAGVSDGLAVAVRDRTLRRIRLLREALDRIEPHVTATNSDAADVGTDELLSLAGLWFGWAFNNPPPDGRQYRTEAWRDWCRRAATP